MAKVTGIFAFFETFFFEGEKGNGWNSCTKEVGSCAIASGLYLEGAWLKSWLRHCPL
jgi:hypothetical protein